MAIDLDLLFTWGAIAKEYKKNEIMKNPLIPYEQIPAFPRKPELITDDNMITEFKSGKGL